MTKISPYKLSLFVKGGRRVHIEKVTTDLWLFLHEQIKSLESGKFSFRQFKSNVLTKANFLEPIFSKQNPVDRLKCDKTLRRAVSKLSKNVELTRMVKHWKKTDRKSSLEVRRLTKAINESADNFLKNQNFKSSDGRIFKLGGLAERQRIKMGERIAITKAMEHDAKQKGMDCLFFTVTCPPEMHPSPKYGKNSYNGTHLQESTKFLNRKISSSFKELSKKGISRENGDVFGFRVIEPHDDACPHIHCLLFIKKAHIRTLVEEVVKAFDYKNQFTYKRRLRNDYKNKVDMLMMSLLQSKNNECKTPSIHFKLIKTSNDTLKPASPSSYLFKYMFEDYDAFLEDDFYGDSFAVTSWRKFVGARSYAVVGWKGFVTAWRDFRKISEKTLLAVDEKISKPALLAKGLELYETKHCGFLTVKLKQSHSPPHLRMLEFKKLLDSYSIEWVTDEHLNKFNEKTKKKIGVAVNNETLFFGLYEKSNARNAVLSPLQTIKDAYRRFTLMVTPTLKTNYPRVSRTHITTGYFRSSVERNEIFRLISLTRNRDPP
jgi:hypothetical protein